MPVKILGFHSGISPVASASRMCCFQTAFCSTRSESSSLCGISPGCKRLPGFEGVEIVVGQQGGVGEAGRQHRRKPEQRQQQDRQQGQQIGSKTMKS